MRYVLRYIIWLPFGIPIVTMYLSNEEKDTLVYLLSHEYRNLDGGCKSMNEEITDFYLIN